MAAYLPDQNRRLAPSRSFSFPLSVELFDMIAYKRKKWYKIARWCQVRAKHTKSTKGSQQAS